MYSGRLNGNMKLLFSTCITCTVECGSIIPRIDGEGDRDVDLPLGEVGGVILGWTASCERSCDLILVPEFVSLHS